MERNEEVDEIHDEDLSAAADMFDELMHNTFYEKQEKSGYRIRYLTRKYKMEDIVNVI